MGYFLDMNPGGGCHFDTIDLSALKLKCRSFLFGDQRYEKSLDLKFMLPQAELRMDTYFFLKIHH